jgi:hypothetical protein
MARRRSSVANPNSVAELVTHGNIRYRPTEAMVVWTELIDLYHDVEGERDLTERHRKFDYCCLPMQFMMKSSSVALLVGRANGIASIRLQ